MHRNVIEERDSLYPAWRLNDTHKWNYWKLLLGAITIMPIRIIGMFATLILVMLSHYVLYWNVDFKKEIPSWKRKISKKIFAIGGYITLLWIGVITVPKNRDTDYSEWLGPDYKKSKEFKKAGQIPTIVSNHCHFCDSPAILYSTGGEASFVAAHHVENMIIMGFLVKSSEGLFVKRSGTTEVRQQLVEEICER